MSLSEKLYNLLDEGWILATDDDGNVKEYSVPEIFEHAHEVRALAGDIPQQDIVVLRFLLAVLYAVYLRNDAEGNPSETDDPEEMYSRWKTLWDKRRFDARVIGEYLEEYRDRFYLFHPTHPFYQAPISKGTVYRASKLNGALSESSNRFRLFKPVSDKESASMGFAEAARWLLFLHSYDDASLKSPSSSDAHLPPCGVGWLGKIGPICADGCNLFETLMLNFVLVDADGCVFPSGVAVWELEKCRVDERTLIPTPDSPLVILTLQSRRVLLQRNQDRVIGYQLLGGDIVAKENAVIEQMTMWRKTASGDLVPRCLDPSRFLWRDFPSLLATSDGDAGRKPGIVSWLEVLIYKNFINDGAVFFRCAGVVYGRNSGALEDLISDNVRFNSNLLGRVNGEWRGRIFDAIEKTDSCVEIFGGFAADVAIMSGMYKERSSKVFQSACETAFARLDQPFRRWLSSVDPSDDIEIQFISWDRILEKQILSMGSEMIKSAGPLAMKNRSEKQSKNHSMNIFSEFRKFKNRVFKKIRGNRDDKI